ncbi:MAG: hypothetical protein RLZ10_259 [Bacteroidota bacterium]|jgi:hypothetical protein
MRLIDELIDLNQQGKLKMLVKNSIISTSVLGWLEIYNFFERDLKLTKSKMQSMENTADKFKVEIRTVQNIRAKLENVISNK